MSYQLSILVPSIRPQNLIALYDSIAKAFSGTWEMIVVSPYELPSNIECKENVQYIQSWRSPIASQQMGLIASRGEYISWASDDGWYLENSLDVAFKSIESEPYTTIVTGKYQEGERKDDGMEKEWYYRLSNHATMKLPGVPKDCYMLNCGIVSRALLIELGGWDATSFQVCPLAYTDFAIRAYRFGCRFMLQEEPMFACGHMPNVTGDHAPIHIAQTYHDQPLFSGLYGTDLYLTRSKIDINNWKNSASVWSMRFKDGEK